MMLCWALAANQLMSNGQLCSTQHLPTKAIGIREAKFSLLELMRKEKRVVWFRRYLTTFRTVLFQYVITVYYKLMWKSPKVLKLKSGQVDLKIILSKKTTELLWLLLI